MNFCRVCLKIAYLASSMNADDGADFHEFNAASKLGAPPNGWLSQTTDPTSHTKERKGYV